MTREHDAALALPIPGGENTEGMEPLGREFEEIWDANPDKLYEP